MKIYSLAILLILLSLISCKTENESSNSKELVTKTSKKVEKVRPQIVKNYDPQLVKLLENDESLLKQVKRIELRHEARKADLITKNEWSGSKNRKKRRQIARIRTRALVRVLGDVKAKEYDQFAQEQK